MSADATRSAAWTVVTVTYNSRLHLEANWTDDRDFTWIVVDNGSTDGTQDFATKHADHMIKSGSNVGFAIANNIGLRGVSTPYVAFVNPDVHISGHDWRQRLAQTVETTGGLVAPQLLNTDGSEQANARGLPFLAAKIRNRLLPGSRRGREYARSGLVQPTYCAWAMGAALAGRTEIVQGLGGWDESYFLYYEDHEIGLRAWRRGLSVTLDPAVRWTHEWQRATTRPSMWAWKAELASMHVFFRSHPEFRRGAIASRRTDTALRNAGYGPLIEHLWLPAGTQPGRGY